MAYLNLKKPFADFKWRWASFTPSEGLNEPRVHLGVLRAMRDNEHKLASSPEFLAALQVVEDDLLEYLPNGLNLARDPERNLLRNSQQYWSGLGLLASTEHGISLTQFGHKIADGQITREEFAAATVKTLTLPNSRIESRNITEKWDEINIKIHPLSLILSIIVELGKKEAQEAYLSTEELVRVVIPLSSVSASLPEYVEHITLFREESNIFDAYEDFAPKANDKRIAREFLLFLSYHGFLSIRNAAEINLKQEFFADPRACRAIKELLNLKFQSEEIQDVAESISDSVDIEMLQRERRLVQVTSRPGQAKFRRDVLKRSGNKCILTGETLSVVLRACHIIPVELNGPDDVGNGICLREDLHILFDSGHLRINMDGEIHLSEYAATSPSYCNLEKSIKFPPHVNLKCIAHRWAYIN